MPAPALRPSRRIVAGPLALAAVGVGIATGTTGAGCAHRQVRFDPSARRTCLVLSAGGTRGVAELGAVAAVREAGVRVDCVVGTSVGALVGALYASAPAEDTTVRFKRLTRSYVDATEQDARDNGIGTGVALGALAALLSGGVLAPATAAVGGFLLGAAATSRADLGRLERMLSIELRGARIEALPVAYATLHHERTDQGLNLVVDRSGDLARAVGASIANPFVFDDVDVTSAAALDPGSDRVAATPVEDACRLFPDSNLLVVNVAGSPAFRSEGTSAHCPVREVMVDVPALPAEAMFGGGPGFDEVWKIGHDRVGEALGSPAS